MRYDKHHTQGRWPSILAALGVEAKTLSKNNVPCPFCDGKDRFRFTDHEGAGVWICNQCGTGNGIQFVMRWENCNFKAAVAKVYSILPQSVAAPPTPVVDPRPKLNKLWNEASPVQRGDPVAEYLSGRCLAVPGTGELRTHPACPYYEDGRRTGEYPAMLARVRDAFGHPKTLHVTYVAGGGKAPVRTPRKVMSKTGEGPTVRLRPPVDGVLCIAEGIETSLAVLRDRDAGAWSCLSAGALAQFQPPAGLRRLEIWADNDASFTGQHAAYSLAHRLAIKSEIEVAVVIPPKVDTDWAD